MSMTANIHTGENIKLDAYRLEARGSTAAFKFAVETHNGCGLEDSATITVFMNDLACLDKLKRAADAFNAIMAEVDQQSENDIINVPVKREVWINYYRETGAALSYPNKEEADAAATPNRTACLHYEWEE